MSKRKTAKNREKVQVNMVGTNGIEYRGKAVKKRKKLEKRQEVFREFIQKHPLCVKSMSIPGSMNGRR